MDGQLDGMGVYVARFEKLLAAVTFENDAGPGSRDAFFNGFMIVECSQNEEGLALTAVQRLSVWANELPDIGGFLDFAGPRPVLEPGEPPAPEQFDAHMFYPLLGEKDPIFVEFDAVYPLLESLLGELSVGLTPGDGDALTGDLTLSLAADPANPLGVVKTVKIVDAPLDFYPLAGDADAAPAHHSLTECSGAPPAGTQANYSMSLRFVSLSVAAGNQPAAGAAAHPLESVAQAQIDSACEVWWQTAGIKFFPAHVAGKLDVEEALNKFGGSPTIAQQQTLRSANSADRDVPNAIMVYLVDTLQGNIADAIQGGAISFGEGTRNAFVVLEIEKARNNRFLLAHELGHVLRLIHPDDPLPAPANNPNALIKGSYCSVMVPELPMSPVNTGVNVTQARATPPLGPLLDAGVGGCTPLSAGPPAFFHMVRDFPRDYGADPSVPRSPATDWWTYSDVWNSSRLPGGTINKYAATAAAGPTPMFNPDHSPVHSEPNRSGTNQLYVRLHTCNPLPGIVQVYLFLAVPGVASEHLRLITPTGANEANPIVFGGTSAPAFADTLPLPGIPAYQKIAWSVPPGYPAHSCVFAAALSPGDFNAVLDGIVRSPGTHSFADLFALLKTDNDVAQRNLHIQGVASGMVPLRTFLSWVQFANPLEKAGRARMIVDASEAADLTELQVVMDSGKMLACQENLRKPFSLELAGSLAAGRRGFLRMGAVLPPGVREGTEFPIHLGFQLGDTLVGGFTHVIRVSPFEEAAAQVLDNVFAALQDAAIATRSDLLMDLAEQVRFQALDNGCSCDKRLSWLAGQSLLLAERAAHLEAGLGFQELAAGRPAEAQQIQDLLLQLPAALLVYDRMAPPAWLEKVRLLADRLQCAAGRVVRERYS